MSRPPLPTEELFFSCEACTKVSDVYFGGCKAKSRNQRDDRSPSALPGFLSSFPLEEPAWASASIPTEPRVDLPFISSSFSEH